MTYPELRAKLCDEYGWLPSDIDDMELDIIESIVRKGKPNKGWKVRTSDDIEMTRRNWKKMIRGFGD